MPDRLQDLLFADYNPPSQVVSRSRTNLAMLRQSLIDVQIICDYTDFHGALLS